MFANKRALHARVVLATNTLESAEIEISAALWVRVAPKWLLFTNLYNLTVTDLWSVHRQDKLTRREIALPLVGFRSSNKHADWRGDSSNDDSNAPNDFYAMPFLYPALRLLCFFTRNCASRHFGPRKMFTMLFVGNLQLENACCEIYRERLAARGRLSPSVGHWSSPIAVQFQ